MTTLDSINKSVLEFNRNAEPFMEEVCEPLKKLGIQYFTYCRSYENGKRLYLCSLPDWVELYLHHSFQNESQHFAYYRPVENIRYAFWSDFKRDRVFDALLNLGIWYGFTIYEKNPGYMDLFDFCTT